MRTLRSIGIRSLSFCEGLMDMQFQRIRLALAVVTLSVSAQGPASSSVVPHVEADSSISWTATIDADTVRTIMGAGEGDERERGVRSPEMIAINRWLDEQLAAVPWCPNKWYYLTDPEPLSDGSIRVKGACRKSSAH
jgi:hypothetical protein